MRKEIILALLILTLVTVACTTSPSLPTPTCQPPYKALGSTCCLDNNNNNQCDDTEEKLDSKACETDANCELDQCLGCINTEWGKANPQRPDCAQFPSTQYECKCIKNACSEVQKLTETKISSGGKVRFDESKLPLNLEMQKDTKILFITSEGDEVYSLDSLQESQIMIFYGNDRFTIKKGTNEVIGPLNFVYTGVNPPNSGNFAMIKITEPEA
ncbi:MAG: hypothetical protein Q8L34_00700 [Candidatus Woesearchaeota archaeon]|nr:hypothetical protein [Candidatus Woesearchaeota archaeon]